MHTFWESLPWVLRADIALVIGLIQCVSILIIPKRTLAAWSTKPYLSPNWITFWGFAFYWAGAVLFFCHQHMVGFQLGVTGCILDVIDGKMAKAMTEAGIPRTAEDIAFGKRIDPLADKGRVLPTLVYMAWSHAIEVWLVIAIIGIDLLGTLMRHPFSLGGDYTRGESATWIGKIKTLTQMFGLIAVLPVILRWTHDARIANTLFSIALVLGVLSVLSRIRLHPRIDEVVDHVGENFTHKDL